MPEQNFTVHFGIHESNLEDVIPGVAGLDTKHEGDSWLAWGVARSVTGYEADALHIQVYTGTPLTTLSSVLRYYGDLMVPSDSRSDYDTGSPLLVGVTERDRDFISGHTGTLALYAGNVIASGRTPPSEDDIW